MSEPGTATLTQVAQACEVMVAAPGIVLLALARQMLASGATVDEARQAVLSQAVLLVTTVNAATIEVLRIVRGADDA